MFLMTYKIVSDSSSNIIDFSGIDYENVPLKIITAKKEYVDDKNLDIEQMVDEIDAEMMRQCDRWGAMTYSKWEKNIANLKTIIQKS